MRGPRLLPSAVIVAATTLIASATLAQPPTTQRVSVDSSGNQGNNSSDWPCISADGRFVAFESFADNLVPGDTLGKSDVFVHDRQTGVTERVSVSSTGAQANDHSYVSSISPDGRFVVFVSRAYNLVGPDVHASWDVFIRDRLLSITDRASTAAGGGYGNNHSGLSLSGIVSCSVSADGRFVAFESWATNLGPTDVNGVGDVYVRDRSSGTTELVSVSSTGDQGNAESGAEVVSISADGRYVAFQSNATNLVPGDANGAFDIFVRDRLNGTTERVSFPSGGGEGNGDSKGPLISSDGRFVTFRSAATNLVSGDGNGLVDVFVHDRLTGSTECISVSSGGIESDGASGDLALSISADGRFVAFNSAATNLVPADTNGVQDVFLRDRLMGTTERVSLAADGTEANAASGEWSCSVSADGRYVGFNSMADNLVANDTNGADDVFVRDRAVSQATVTGRLVANVGHLPATATFEFRQPSQTAAFGTWVAPIAPDGSFAIPAPAGVFDLSTKVTHWLRRTVSSVDATSGGADVGTLQLTNGDANGDNSVNLLDLSTVLATFGTTGPRGDLTDDGLVNLLDLSTVLANFGKLGDG